MEKFKKSLINWRHETEEYQIENKFLSWLSVSLTLVIIGVCVLLIIESPIYLKVPISLILGLSLVRLFSLYHEYNHGAILRGSVLGKWLMVSIGFVLLAPRSLWKNYHDLHHKENSRFSLEIMGDFPTVTVEEYAQLTKKEQKEYLIKRDFWVIFLGYLTIFILSFNLRPFRDNPKKHLLGFICLMSHIGLNAFVYYTCGFLIGLLILTVPLLIFGFIGGLVFYLQHNCKVLKLYNKDDWEVSKAGVYSSSFIRMNRFWRFFTANVGYHSVHHLNPLIPHYYLDRSMKVLADNFPDLPVIKFSLNTVVESAQLKLYDTKKHTFVSLDN